MSSAVGRQGPGPAIGVLGACLLTGGSLLLMLLVAGADQVRWVSPGEVPFDYTRSVAQDSHPPFSIAETDLVGTVPPNPFPPPSNRPAPSFPSSVYLAVVLAVVVVLLAVTLRWLLAARAYRAQQQEPEIDPLVHQMRVVAEGEATHVGALLRGGSPRNAIVGCWVALEDTVARLGMTRSEADTATDTVQRLLSTWPVDQDALAELAQRYRVARFSEHEIDETARQQSLSALERFHRSLDRAVRKTRPRGQAGQQAPEDAR